MADANNNEATEMGCNADFGQGQRFELEYRKAGELWLTTGPGIEAADVWLKGGDVIPDLRVRIERQPDGIHVLVDRGQQSQEWWPHDGTPQLKLVFDSPRRRVAAMAGAGRGDNFQEVLLGEETF